MQRLEEIGLGIVADAADVARQITIRWTVLARDEPWLEHLTRIRQDNLPDMIRALARAALVHPESAPEARELIHQARAHGASRREAGYEDSIIPAEYVLLRRSLRHILIRERRTPPDLLLATLSRLELGIGTAEAASLHGYHAVGEESREDPDARLLQEWSGLIHEVVSAGRE